MKQMVKATFGNHFYSWDGKIYKQRKGGGTGLRGTGSVARCVMDEWCEKMSDKMDEAGITAHMFKKYVDDVALITSMLELGSRWKNGKLTKLEEDRKIEEDMMRT